MRVPRPLATLFVALLVVGRIGAEPQPEPRAALTLYGWSDQHVLPDGGYEHCLPSIEALRALPGTPYPDAIGGAVGEPAFVLSAGDLTEWPSHAAVEGYEALTRLLPWPTHEVAGNHDDGGEAPSETLLDFLRTKHGGLDYSFDAGGVHFVCLFTSLPRGATSPEGPVFPQTLSYLREDLSRLDPDQPTIVVMHHCLDSLTNKGELADALADRNVMAILGGHYHKAVVGELAGIACHQLPSPKSDEPAVSVIRVTGERLTICSLRVSDRAWLDGVTLDRAIRRGRAEAP